MEQSDLILVNKSDGDLLPAARRTATEYTSALKFMRQKTKFWKPKVSFVKGLNIDVIKRVLTFVRASCSAKLQLTVVQLFREQTGGNSRQGIQLP